MATATASSLTCALAQRASALTYEQLPGDVRELARQALVDWYGVTLAGSREPGPRILLQTLAREERDGEATVVGGARRLPPRDAALVNGTASHVLDFDDVNLTLPGHVTVAVLGAALALGERLDVAGAELLTAFVAGYETACRVAVAVGREPYQRGFHATGTIGIFGAAAACARLLGLDEGATGTALGIAASAAAGLKCNMGTMTKSLHAGRACESGLLAAELASRGFSANEAALEAEQGFAAICAGGCDAGAALAEPPAGWHLRSNLFKHHASCWFTHSAIEGVAELRDAQAVDPAEVRRIVLHVSEVELGACVIEAPASGLEVKFSIAHLAAMALLGRDTAAIGDGAAADAEAAELRGRVELRPDGAAGAPTRVEIELGDGRQLEAARDVDLPERDLLLQRERLEEKFRVLAAPVLGAGRAEQLLALLGRVEELGVREPARAAGAGG